MKITVPIGTKINLYGPDGICVGAIRSTKTCQYIPGELAHYHELIVEMPMSNHKLQLNDMWRRGERMLCYKHHTAVQWTSNNKGALYHYLVQYILFFDLRI